MVFEERRTKAVQAAVTRFAAESGATASHTTGYGKMIGSWDNRAQGAAAYTKVINTYLAGRPALKASWQAMVDQHHSPVRVMSETMS